jgi:hypothetical protein
MNKVIVYGNKWVNKDLKDSTHRVTAIHIDNHSAKVTFNIERGTTVDQVHLTMEACQDLGIINLEKLEGYCK